LLLEHVLKILHIGGKVERPLPLVGQVQDFPWSGSGFQDPQGIAKDLFLKLRISRGAALAAQVLDLASDQSDRLMVQGSGGYQ
ncbi:MAG: hypothetical protein JRJ83_05505, partial [Deltaproteobacteria bacterium]|nr:hypothetical protein [Deltaproteobacteria bacterium]